MYMDYKNMITSARNAGVATEKIMWQSIDGLNEMLCKMKEEHPDMFWKFMREQHGIMYSNHYDEAFALYDVSMIRRTVPARSAKAAIGQWSRLNLQPRGLRSRPTRPNGTSTLLSTGFMQTLVRFLKTSLLSKLHTSSFLPMRTLLLERYGYT